MKIYVSGKITGLDEFEVLEKFKIASLVLENKGYTVINPIELPIDKPTPTWEQYMVVDIEALLHCDAIYMLKDWGQSKGARVEYAIARELGLKIMFEGEFNN